MENRQEHGPGLGGGCGHGWRACTPTGSVVLRIFAPTLVLPIFVVTYLVGGNLFSGGDFSVGNLLLSAAYVLLPIIQFSLAGLALGSTLACWRRRQAFSRWFVGFLLFACVVDLFAVVGLCAAAFLTAASGVPP